MKITKLILPALLLMMCGKVVAQCPAHNAHCDTRFQLAEDYMYSRFDLTDSGAGMVVDGNVDYTPAYKARLERREHTFEKLEMWAKTLKDPLDRQAYIVVIGWYEDGAKDAYSEWHTHKEIDAQNIYEQHQRECEAATRRDAKAHPLPKPPENLK